MCSNKTVSLTLWGAAAETTGADLEATAAAGPVVSISRCRISDYNGMLMCLLAATHSHPGTCSACAALVEMYHAVMLARLASSASPPIQEAPAAAGPVVSISCCRVSDCNGVLVGLISQPCPCSLFIYHSHGMAS